MGSDGYAGSEGSGEELAAYMATLLPLQQQTIAKAQLAGCRFERSTVQRFLGWDFAVRKSNGWIETTTYEVFLPDGTAAGTGEDIYECALIALSILDTPSTPTETLTGLFKLSAENEQTSHGKTGPAK
jgi:hypothetical protein